MCNRKETIQHGSGLDIPNYEVDHKSLFHASLLSWCDQPAEGVMEVDSWVGGFNLTYDVDDVIFGDRDVVEDHLDNLDLILHVSDKVEVVADDFLKPFSGPEEFSGSGNSNELDKVVGDESHFTNSCLGKQTIQGSRCGTSWDGRAMSSDIEGPVLTKTWQYFS